MAKVLAIRIIGDDILRKKLKAAELSDPALPKFIAELTETMYVRDGVGLAASQVGVDLRVCVIDPWWAHEDTKQNPIVMINPEILHSEGEQVGEEGCISLPDIFAKVTRAQKIRYTYTNPQGEKIEAEAEGYEAIVIQHEYDHLNGVLFTDRIGTLAKLRLMHKIKVLQERAQDGVNIYHPED